MSQEIPHVKMPELLVFARTFSVGFAGAEIFRLAFYLGSSFATEFSGVASWLQTIALLTPLAICLAYAFGRGGHFIVARICRSLRFDLFAVLLVGIWSNELTASLVSRLHDVFKLADAHWAPATLICLCIVLLSPMVQRYWPKPKISKSQLVFMADEEVSDVTEDLLDVEAQSKSFAETVLASGAHAGLVFGIDGPWGVGKTSFVNMAERYWNGASEKVVVCRFEPLRYASEPDLTDRLIRELTATIQNKVFAPEFRPAASRYSRLIKGKTDVSFLGFKISLEPSQETVDELLDDIDAVLRRLGRRVIIVIDDLDRLDTKALNNVLFTAQRTFKLSQATYVLCYDTEILVGSKEEGQRARNFLEKFVTMKLSLFIDTSSLRDFLRRDWKNKGKIAGAVPADTLIKLGGILYELAEIMDGDLAANYMPLVGDLRKIKRFVNAVLLMQIEKTDLGKTDFNKRDLINLMLLHLHYPEVFRRIYAEETEGRKGTFSVNRKPGGNEYENSVDFERNVAKCDDTAGFLLKQLFDAVVAKTPFGGMPESVLRSRACFNSGQLRNLEAYLKLIVRFATPEPQETFVLYQNAVEEVKNGRNISSVLSSADFTLARGEHAHDQFWRLLIDRCSEFSKERVDEAIKTLINFLPQYSAFDIGDRGLRMRSVYSLLFLLDRAGWGRASGQRKENSSENVVEIAWRVFGEESYLNDAIIEQLAAHDRGVLGWNDLMIFRLYCSADRNSQLYELQRSLIVNQDVTAATTGLTNDLSLFGMRKLSQRVFAIFKRRYIDSGRNFLAELRDLSPLKFVGVGSSSYVEEALRDPLIDLGARTVAQHIAASRSGVGTFVIYQLSNSHPPTGSGPGCGLYDEEGMKDEGGIAKAMNDYMFENCFNPEVEESNGLLFLDSCLSHLSVSIFRMSDDGRFVATKEELPGGLDPMEMGKYWQKHRDVICGLASRAGDRRVFTYNYIASYQDDLGDVFSVLDELADLSSGSCAHMDANTP